MADTAVARVYPNLIGGKEVASAATFESRNSSDLADLVGVFPEAGREEVRQALEITIGEWEEEIHRSISSGTGRRNVPRRLLAHIE